MAGALVAVLLAAMVVTFTGGDPEPSAAGPGVPVASGDVAPEAADAAMAEEPSESPSASPTVKPSPRPSLNATQLIAGLRTTIVGLAENGQLTPKAAEELTKRLREAAEKQAAGEEDKAREKLAEFGEKVAELRKENKISEAGYQTLAAGLAQLVRVLPSR
ncbi:FIMAH domain-containing protein [Micromonospora sp. L32]